MTKSDNIQIEDILNNIYNLILNPETTEEERNLLVTFKNEIEVGKKDNGELLAEIQIRTLAMNFWATIEHSLNYKYQGNFPEEIKLRLETTARMAYELDEEMRKIRDDIREAQLLFDPINRTLKDSVGNSDDTDEDLFG